MEYILVDIKDYNIEQLIKGTKMKGNEQLKQMLPGLTDEMPECFKRIAELLDYGAFELCEQHGKDGAMQYVIPYILNDAVECYLDVLDASLQGEYVQYFSPM